MAAYQLAGLPYDRGDLDEPRARADAGNEHAARRLPDLLNEPRAQADAGNGYAAARLADPLTKQGRAKDSEQLRRFGLAPDGSIARK